MAQLENVQSSGDNFTGRLENYDIEFGRVKEPPAWRTGEQQNYYANRYWWVTTEKEPRKIYIMREKPEEGRTLDIEKAVAVHNRDDIAT